MKHVTRDMTQKSILAVRGAFASISVRGEGILHVDIVSPLDATGVVIVRPWGTTTNRRLSLGVIVSAAAASVSSRAEMRAIVERQRAQEKEGDDATASPLPVGVKLDLVLNVAGGGRGRREHWRGSIVRLVNDLVEFSPIGCGDTTVEFIRDQIVTWRPARSDHGRTDRERIQTNRARLGLSPNDDRSST